MKRFIAIKCYRKSFWRTFFRERSRLGCPFISEKCLKRIKTLLNLIRRISIRNSWKRIFPLTPQHFGDVMERILCFLWSIERLWAIQSQRVYRNPRPTHISGVMRRLREEVRNTDPATLTKLVHALPAKMNEIYRLKGAKIPSNFDHRQSEFACKCSVCCDS